MFVAYLWGIETHLEASVQLRETQFVAYLWGIETLKMKSGYFGNGLSL